MLKRLTIQLEEDLYRHILTRAGGPRKVSAYLNNALRANLAGAGRSPVLSAGDLHEEVARLAQELDALAARLPPREAG